MQVALWGTDINRRISGAIETIASNGGLQPRKKIYQGESHYFSERGYDSKKELLKDFETALDSMNKGQELRGFERWS